MLFFADSGERAIVQALAVGTVVGGHDLTLLVISFLDNPYEPGVGSLRPVAMERTLRILDQERRIVGDTDAAAVRRAGRRPQLSRPTARRCPHAAGLGGRASLPPRVRNLDTRMIVPHPSGTSEREGRPC